jgi:hypothetical protein
MASPIAQYLLAQNTLSGMALINDLRTCRA